MDHIPANTGKYLVGCADFMTKKAFRPSWKFQNADPKSSPQIENGFVQSQESGDLNTPGYFMRLFYPTVPEVAKQHERAHWIPKQLYADGFTSFMHLPILLFGRITNWILGHTRMHAYLDAPLYRAGKNEHEKESCDHDAKDTESLLPVVIFSHGLGANRTCYSSFCADLASRGFLVAAVEHRDQSASATYYIDDDVDNKEVYMPFRKLLKEDDEFALRNSQVQQRALEVSMALSILEKLNECDSDSEPSIHNVVGSSFDFSTLKGALNLNDVSIVGHSFGGATTINTMSKDKRFKCGIVYDAWMFPLGKEVYDKVDQPLLFVNSESFHWKDNIKLINQLIGKDENKKMLTIRGTGHHSQCDIPSIVPSWMLKVFKMHAPLKQDIAMSLQRKLLVSFLKENSDMKLFNEAHKNDEELTDYVMEGTNLKNADSAIHTPDM